MEFQNTKRALKAIYGHSNYNSSVDDLHKQLYIMYGGSWDITSRRVIKTHRRVAAAAGLHREQRPTPSDGDIGRVQCL
jgi:hypothetical protein